MIQRDSVIEILSKIIEPDLKKDIVSLNLVEDLKIMDNEIHLTVYVTNPAMHARNRMKEAVVFNLKSRLDKRTEIYCTVKQKTSELNDVHRKILPKTFSILRLLKKQMITYYINVN